MSEAEANQIIDPTPEDYRPSDEEITQFTNDLRNEQSGPFIGELTPLQQLAESFDKENPQHARIMSLCESYPMYRAIRRDGNCFLRAFAFQYLEHLLADSVRHDEAQSFRARIAALRESLVAPGSGYHALIVDDFYEALAEPLDALLAGTLTPDALVALFNDAGESEGIVMFLRLVIAGHLRENSEFFGAFLAANTDGCLTIEEYITQEVQPMYRESDQIHIIALAEALHVGVCIQSVDSRPLGAQTTASSAEALTLRFPDHLEPSVTLLFRPGHYDCLYAR